MTTILLFIALIIAALSIALALIWRSRLVESNKKLLVAEEQEKELSSLRIEQAKFQMQHEQDQKTNKELNNLLSAKEEQISRFSEKEMDLQIRITNLQSELGNANEKLTSFKEEMSSLREQSRLIFAETAQKIFEEKTNHFTKQNQEQLSTILDPFKESMKEFKKKVEETYVNESQQRESLKTEVRLLTDLNKKISKEANELTSALKGNTKVQGNWGEMILESILEKSGLTRGREYHVQETLRDLDNNVIHNEESNRIMRPDVIVSYPDGRQMIIDSKVSLKAYADYVNATEDAERSHALKKHLDSIKNHIEELSRKSYEQYGKTLDFVMMFVPSEPAFLTAMENDLKMWEYAYEKKIVIVGPSNLIAALKLCENLWKREYQIQNVEKIAKAGGALYDKLVNFLDTFLKIEGSLKKSMQTYEEAKKQLHEGSGNLIRKAENMKALGIKTKKNIPGSLLENDEDEQVESAKEK